MGGCLGVPKDVKQLSADLAGVTATLNETKAALDGAVTTVQNLETNLATMAEDLKIVRSTMDQLLALSPKPEIAALAVPEAGGGGMCWLTFGLGGGSNAPPPASSSPPPPPLPQEEVISEPPPILEEEVAPLIEEEPPKPAGPPKKRPPPKKGAALRGAEEAVEEALE